MEKPISLSKLRFVIRDELQTLDKTSKMELRKKYNKDIFTMNRKQLEQLRAEIKHLLEQPIELRFHQLLQNQELNYASKNILQYLYPKERFKTSLVSKKGKTIYDMNLSLLQTIDLSDTWDVLSFIQFVLPRMRFLKKLDLTGRIKSFGDNYCIALNNALPHLNKLTVLKLGDNLLSRQNLLLMKDGFQSLQNLKTLDMAINILNVDGVSLLLSIIAELPQLEVLNLKYTFVISFVNKKKIQIFTIMSRLKHLYLDSNYLKSQDFTFLDFMPNLQFLSLTSCSIDDTQMNQLIKHIQSLLHLEILILNNNPITDKSIDLLLSFIHLKILGIKNTKVSISKIQELKNSMTVYA